MKSSAPTALTALKSKATLTEEQNKIIQADGDLRINAVAGSGKTTTMIEYAASRKPAARILYLAFNKSVKLEAIRRFKERGLTHVKVETAHSLAFRGIISSNQYAVKTQGYSVPEIVELLSLEGNGEKHTEYIIANHISKFIIYFCNSKVSKVQELSYLDTITDPKAKGFVKTFYKYIEDGTRLLLARMNAGEIPVTHDFYLKKFQLSHPVLPFDYILFDEGQDASATMLDIFQRQKAVRVIVGDTHQQIYSWRYAVNSLDQTSFPELHLSTSFRFNQDIANLATEILYWKNHLYTCKPVAIKGQGSSKATDSHATIARTNLGLLLNAIEYITDHPKVKQLYFEGNIHSYTYADDGASLYDVLSLFNQQHDRIRDKLIRSMNSMTDLELYIEKTEDIQLKMMVDIVNEYGTEISGILKKLKELHTGDEDRSKAQMIFSTVHRAKGMEYDVVRLVNDFLSESKLKKLIAEAEQKKEPLQIARWNEEINLLYVAVTRTKNRLLIPELLVPDGFPVSKNIEILPVNKEMSDQSLQDKNKPADYSNRYKPKKYTVREKKVPLLSSNKSWTDDMDEVLKKMYTSDHSISEIAEILERSTSAVTIRLKRFNYFD